MKWPSRTRASTLAIALVMAGYGATAWMGLWRGDPGKDWRSIVRSDVKGYYGYLRAVFITHDLGNEKHDEEYIKVTPDGTLNKYFAGEAVMLLPFFLGAHGVAHATGHATDGLSEPYLKVFNLAALTYLLLGLLAWRALLRRMPFRENTIAFVVLLTAFGTQLYQYAVFQPGWTHVYSFSAIAVLLLCVEHLAQRPRAGLLIAAAALLGLIVIVRPVNAIVLLAVPVVLGDRSTSFLRSLFARPPWLVGATAAGAAVIGIQLLLWHAQTGHWIQWGYQGEGFNWGRPRMGEVLFGIRRGVFVWTPVLIAAIVAAVLLWRSDRPRSGWVLAYWVVLTYITSAWWIWYYGGGFGHRVYIDHYPVLMLPLAMVLDRARAPVRRSLAGFAVLATLFHLIQFWQYRHDIFDHVAMDREKYAWSFMRFGMDRRNAMGGNDQEPYFHPNGLRPALEETCDLETACTFWKGGRIEARPEVARSGTHVCVLDGTSEFSVTLMLDSQDVGACTSIYLEIEMHRYSPHPHASFEALGVATRESPGQPPAYYEPWRMNPLPDDRAGTWERIRYRFPMEPPRGDQQIRFYIWNKSRSSFLIDDVSAKVWAAEPW